MEGCFRTNEFKEFKKVVDKMFQEFKRIEEEVNQDVDVKYDLKKYDQIIEGNDDNLIFEGYATLYDKLYESVVNKQIAIKQNNEAIGQISDAINYITNLTNETNPKSIISKEKENADKLITKLNMLVDRMIEKKDDIYSKNEQLILQKYQEEADKRKLKHVSEKDNLSQMKHIHYKLLTQFPNDKEMQQIEESMDYLKEWSGKQNYSIVFDSNKDGNGSKNGLTNKVINKQNLYFISFDDSGNVYGGYVNQKIDKKQDFITDPNSFVFSLLRNGVKKNTRYLIQPGKGHEAFFLANKQNFLYTFGKSNDNDIRVHTVGEQTSSCYPNYYEYNGETLVDKKPKEKFIIKRVIVLEMN